MRIAFLGFAVLGLAVAGCQGPRSIEEDLASAPPGKAQAGGTVAADAKDDAAPDLAAPDMEIVTGSVAAQAKSGVSVDAYVPPRTGTVFTFRNNWATLPPVATYTVDGVVSAGGKKYLRLTTQHDSARPVRAYYDAANFALKGFRDETGEPLLTYKPVEERFRFPMRPGDRWTTQWRSFDHRKKTEINGGGVVEVMAWEDIELPAGRFRTLKVRMPAMPGMPDGMTHFVWFAPTLGITVKEQIGAGALNWTQILESVRQAK